MLDIFRVEPTGEVLWVKSAADFKSARLAVHELMASSPHAYVIHSHITGNDLTVKPPRAVHRATKPLIFQIAYHEQLVASRATLLKSDGFTVVSALGNEAAKLVLEKPQHHDLFIVGHAAVKSGDLNEELLRQHAVRITEFNKDPNVGLLVLRTQPGRHSR